MGKAEDIVRARREAERRQSEETERQKNAPLLREMEQLASQALATLDDLNFPEMKALNPSYLWEGERHVAWRLIDYYNDGFHHEIYLLSTGIVVSDSYERKQLTNSPYMGVWLERAIVALKKLKAGEFESLPLKE